MSKSGPPPKGKGKPLIPPSGPHGRKAAHRSKPTLPQHQFPAPYDRLLTLGDREDVTPIHQEIAALLKEQDARRAVKQLVAMALDETYYAYQDVDHWNPKETRDWTRLHAVGVLAWMGDAARQAVEPLLVLMSEEDDELREEMPIFYGRIGEPALDTLRRILFDAEEDPDVRVGASDALAQMAEFHPDLRGSIIPLLEQGLIIAGEETELAACAICGLLDLQAKESLPLIRQAFAEGRVDEEIVGMFDVEEAFGLSHSEEEEKAPTQKALPATSSNLKPFVDETLEIEDYLEAEEEIDGYDPPPSSSEAPTPGVPFVKEIKLGRNEPCWCGSGKKFKVCHGR